MSANLWILRIATRPHSLLCEAQDVEPYGSKVRRYGVCSVFYTGDRFNTQGPLTVGISQKAEPTAEPATWMPRQGVQTSLYLRIYIYLYLHLCPNLSVNLSVCLSYSVLQAPRNKKFKLFHKDQKSQQASTPQTGLEKGHLLEGTRGML